MRRMRVMGATARRLVATAGVLVVATTGLAACRGGSAHASNADIQKWLSAVQNFSNDADQGQDCFLLARGQLVSDLSHPHGLWTATGNNDQTGDSRKGFSCSIKSNNGMKGDGEVGIELTSTANAPDSTQRVGVLKGTNWSLYESAWPGRAPSQSEFNRVMRDAELNLSISPPETTPQEGVLVGPEDPVSTK